MKDLANKFYYILWSATAARSDYTLDEQNNPAWVKNERKLLLEEVNVEREARGLPLVKESDIAKGESVGHPTYGKVLAEHCARLACGD